MTELKGRGLCCRRDDRQTAGFPGLVHRSPANPRTPTRLSYVRTYGVRNNRNGTTIDDAPNPGSVGSAGSPWRSSGLAGPGRTGAGRGTAVADTDSARWPAGAIAGITSLATASEFRVGF